jgi:transcriptional regulator of acetoin/glycerol metabolism
MEEVELAEDAKQKLLSYNYPGNLHEMKNVLELALAMSDKKKITASDITFAPVQLQHNFLVEEKTLDEYNAEIVKHFLKKYNEDVNLVAEKLGVGRSTVYKWLREGKLDK